MATEADDLDFDYANDLHFVKAIFEDDSFWESILDAKLAFLNEGADPHSFDCVRPEVAESWILSRNLGIEPDRTETGDMVTELVRSEAIADNTALIKAAESLLSNIDSLKLKNDYIFELLDIDGVPLIQIGDLKLHSFSGLDYRCNEASMGTNAHTLSMRHKRPFIIVGPEHYCFALHGLIACAAPILDQFNTSIGALVLTEPVTENTFKPEGKRLLVHATSLLSSLAESISARLRINEYDTRITHAKDIINKTSLEAQHYESVSHTILDSVRESIVVCDNRGLVTYATPEACLILKLSMDDLLGENIVTLLNIGHCVNLTELIAKNGKVETVINDVPYMAKVRRIYSSKHDSEGFIITFGQPLKNKNQLGTARGKTGDAAPIMFKDILGKSPQIEHTKQLAIRYSHSHENILLLGESGTGKELFAQAIHNESRPNGPFMSINCAAIPPRLIESELFGYESGSFTGAERGGKAGKIEMADGGTLFLDEIGDMPLELQATLLRVLENKRIIRIGGKTYKQVDFNLVAATNQNLPELVRQNKFREDLLYRLSVLTVNIPPLRDRTGDPLFFARYFLDQCQIKTNDGRAQLTEQAADFISQYRWPGNVRQLKHAIYSAYYTCENSLVTIEDFPAYIVDETHRFMDVDETATSTEIPSHNETSSSVKVPSANESSSAQIALPTLSLKELERLAIAQALEQAEGNIAAAAEILDISKATLYRKLKETD